jgi:hypothetical protein
MKSAVMGNYLGNQQDIATGAMQNRSGAEQALLQQRLGLENSALGGSQDISQSQALRGQIGSMQAAQTQIPVNIMGGMINTLAQGAVTSSKMNAMGYNTPNFFGSGSTKQDKPQIT